MTPMELEEAVLDIEGIRIVVRAGRRAAMGDQEEYGYTRKAADNSSIREWLDRRIVPLLNGYEVSVVNGEGVTPNGQMSLGRLRASYQRD